MGETALAVREQEQTALAPWGEGVDLNKLAERFLIFFQIGDPKTSAEKQAQERELAKPAALAAAQKIVRFGMTPMTHIYIVKRGGKYQAEDAIEAWKAWADRHAFLGKFRYDLQYKPMTPAEVKANTPPSIRYTEEDCGCYARVIRFDLAKEYKEIGLQYDPPWYTGFWRKEAYEEQEWSESQRKYIKTGKWVADQLPNQRTPADVAQRRAMRAAYKANFTPIELDDFENRMGSIERAAQWRLAQAMNYMNINTPEPATVDSALPGVEPYGKVADDEGLFIVERKPPASVKVNGNGHAPAPVVAVEEPEDADFYEAETPEPDVPPMAQLEAMPAGQPAPADGWGDWVTEADAHAAYTWAWGTGKFKSGNHLRSAWDKHIADHASDTPAAKLAAWREYVNNHK